jgi:uncharacterized protein (TIGR02996 family)
MSLDSKLVAEIVEHPLEDASRLVLADALLEKGDPRGHFIVAQCRLAERGVPRDERNELKRTVASLLANHGTAWAGTATQVGEYTMRRGFVDEVTATAAKLTPVCAELFATQPISRLTLSEASEDSLGELAKAGAFARVLRLTIRGSIGDGGARLLAAALAVRKTPLLSLNVGSNAITASGAAALVGVLSGCQSVAFTSNQLGDDGVVAIAKAKSLGSLTTLFLTDNEVTDDGVRALAKSSSLGALVRLGIGRNEEVTSSSLAALASAKKLKSLRWLEYGDEDGFQVVAVRRR